MLAIERAGAQANARLLAERVHPAQTRISRGALVLAEKREHAGGVGLHHHEAARGNASEDDEHAAYENGKANKHPGPTSRIKDCTGNKAGSRYKESQDNKSKHAPARLCRHALLDRGLHLLRRPRLGAHRAYICPMCARHGASPLPCSRLGSLAGLAAFFRYQSDITFISKLSRRDA